jgi:long-subunit acyl-CoA synthetase (AMP-forming)
MMAAPPVPDTIPELFDEAVAAAPSRVWLRTDGRSFTFGEAHALVERAASAMGRLGVGRGDLVLATARNTPEYLFAWLATTCAGAIVVAVNPLAGDRELTALIRQVQPRLVVTDGDAPDAVRSAGAVTVDVAALYAEAAGPGRRNRPGPDDPAALIPTSGTTGRSKLVTQTHRAYAMAGEGFPWWMELGPEDRLMTSRHGPDSSCSRGSLRAPSSTRSAGTARPSSTPSARCWRSSCGNLSGRTTPIPRFASVTQVPRRRKPGKSRSSAGSAFESSADMRSRSRRME